MDANCLRVYLRTRQTRPDGRFIWLNDPDDLMLDVLETYSDRKLVRVVCPSLFSDPSEYSFAWYLRYPDREFVFEGPFATRFEQAAKARKGEWF